jgi:hypothetical protein
MARAELSAKTEVLGPRRIDPRRIEVITGDAESDR